MNTYHPGARFARLLLAILLPLALITLLVVLAGNAHPTAAATVSYTSPAAVRASVVLTPVAYFPLILKPTPPCDAPPCLLSPENGAKITTLAPLFVWNAGPPSGDQSYTYLSGVDWQLFYCRVPCSYPGSGLVSARGTGLYRFGTYEHDANLQPGTTYAWHVTRCNNYSEQCQDSQTWTFTTPGTVTLPPAPAIITPTSGSVVQGPWVKFEWSPVEGALDYDFCLEQGGFPYSSHCRWLGSTQPSLQLQLYPADNWHWHVAALGPQGEGPGIAAAFQVIGTPGSAPMYGPLRTWSAQNAPDKVRTWSPVP